MNPQAADNSELFAETAFEQLQFLRDYAGTLLDPCPLPETVDQLFQAAQLLSETTAQYGLPLFAEVASKLAHLFRYALTTTLSPDSCGPIVDFVLEAVALLESDLLHASTNHVEASPDIEAFKKKYPFAFQAPAAMGPAPPPLPVQPATSPGAVGRGALPDTAVADLLTDNQPQPGPEPEPAPEPEPLPEDSELPPDVLEFFVPEAEEHLQTVTECLLSLEADSVPDSQEIHRLFRAMHTLKGSAAQVGLARFAHLAHCAEDLIGRLREHEIRPTASLVDTCLETVDVLKKTLYRQWPDAQSCQTAVDTLLAKIAREAPARPGSDEELAGGREERAASPPPDPETAAEVLMEPAGAASDGSAEPASADHAAAKSGAAQDAGRAGPSKSVRIPLDRLDRMMNVVGELVINRTRMFGRMGDLERLADVLNFSKGRLIDKIGEFQERYEFTRLKTSFGSGGPVVPETRQAAVPWESIFLRNAQTEFTDLELDRYDDFNILARSLTEISADLTEVLSQLGRFVRQVDSELDEFTNLAHRLQDEITQARMVPIRNLYTRLSRTVRDSAKAAGKLVELSLAGGETDLDNGIIQQISDPLVHLLRNAVAHGIESPEERTDCGKPADGQVAVRASQRGNQIHIEVEDDGRGIDYEGVRAAAVSRGMATPEEAPRLTHRDLLQILFQPGFSTASSKTELAGRGVGLDVVRTNLSALNGEISVDTEAGAGTRFTLQLPLTLIITQALFLRYGEWTFGIPLSCVEEIRRLQTSEIETVGGKLLTRVRDQVMEVVRLDSRLGLPQVEPVNGHYRMVTVNVSGRQVGLVVEEVLRKDEIVIKGLGEYLRNVKLFSGATIAPDGKPILLLDVGRLVVGDAEQAVVLTSSGALQAPARPVAAPPRLRPKGEKCVLLADDSISVRRFVGRMLDKAGYQVRFASDGFEALESVNQNPCDLVLTDLEMPRTNGYELMAHLRRNPATRHIPIVVVTSRAGAKHRDKAVRDGASAFLTKPVREEELLAVVGKLLGKASPAAGAPVAAGKNP